MSEVAALVDAGDVDDLLRLADRLCDAGDWDALLELRDRSRKAFERGRQLWPVASHVEYRVALDGPPEAVAEVLVPGAGRFALGPLPEVAATRHTWDELAGHLEPGPLAAVVAQERVVRGEDLSGVDPADLGVPLEVPLALGPWEPAYPLAVYRADAAEFPPPPAPPLERVALPGHEPEVVGDPDSTQALEDLVRPWATESNGSVGALCAEGGLLDALRATGRRSAWVAEVDRATAVAHLAWAGASGGAHGRRRGMAAGRFGAWWALAALAGLVERWPVSAVELGGLTAHLRFALWAPDHEVTASADAGWALRLVACDPDEELAWVVEATDSA